jgi:hypothetical protein
MPNSSDSLVTAIKLKTKYKFCVAAMLLFCILQKITVTKKYIFLRHHHIKFQEQQALHTLCGNTNLSAERTMLP